MKYHRLMLLLIGILLLAGCGTSQEVSDSLMSVPEDTSWADLTVPETSPRPETGTVLPELDAQVRNDAEGEDVTADYKDSVVGIWDNDKRTKSYEFKSNENLVITAGSKSVTYTYWFVQVNNQPRLCIYENGQEDAETYSFTLKNTNMTLYNPSTGDAVEQLTRRVVVSATPTPAPAPTTAVTAAPAPTAEPAPTVTTAPSEAPAPSPTPETPAKPSIVPAVSPSPTIVPVPTGEPSPSPSPVVELPSHVYSAMPRIECVVDVIMDGTGMDVTNPDSFWCILAHYMSLHIGSDDTNHFTVSQDTVVSYAAQIFPGFTDVSQIPACPSDTALVTQVDGETGTEYRVLWGAAKEHTVEVKAYEDGVLTILVDDGSTFRVTVNEDGTIASVEAVTGA